MIERWIRWEPIKGLSKKYYIESITDNIRGFKIILSDSNDENKKLQITFGNSVDSYKSTYESFQQKMLFDLEQKYGPDFFTEWTYFKVLNSEYLAYLSQQSYGITDSLSLMHFSFISMEFIVDIIASSEPKVKFITSKNKKSK